MFKLAIFVSSKNLTGAKAYKVSGVKQMISSMMELLKIFALSFSMFAISYLCGILPLIINFSKKKLEMLTIFGSGILIGTALGIIIPEGLQMLSTSDQLIFSNSVDKVGPFIIGGFIFMLLIDMIVTVLQKADTSVVNTLKITTTIGLVIHAAADGLALGAAASTKIVEVEIVVFLAIMVHKGPAAFTLTTFLVQSSLDRYRIRKHLLVFSLAAPLAAILTYLSLVLMKSNQGEPLTPSSLNNDFKHNLTLITNESNAYSNSTQSTSASAYAMLFSAGTFLYVAALHVLPEVGFNQESPQNSHSSYRSKVRSINSNLYSGPIIGTKKKSLENDAQDDMENDELLLTTATSTTEEPLPTLHKYFLLGLGLSFPFFMSLTHHTTGDHKMH